GPGAAGHEDKITRERAHITATATAILHRAGEAPMSLPPFRDRHDAGRRLADALAQHAPLRNPVVLALPRGGVPVGWEVARALGAPLDVMVVRKLGVPGHAELAMGAIASGGIRVVSDEVVQALAIPARVLADTAV